MYLLFLSGLQNRKHLLLLIITVIGMCGFTIASQMEIGIFGVITNKGVDAFSLFGSEKEEGRIYKEEINKHWKSIDLDQKGYISKKDIERYAVKKNKLSFLDKVIAFVDHYLDISNDLINLVCFIVIIALFKAVMLFVHRYTTRLVAIRISCDLRQKYFEHIQTLSMNFYQKHDIGGLSSRVIGDANLIAESLNSCLVNYLQLPFTALSTLIICFFISSKLSLLVFFVSPLIIAVITLMSIRVKKIARKILKNQENFTSVLVDFLAGIQTIKIFGMEDFSLKKYIEQNDAMAVLEEKSARYSLATRPIIHSIGMGSLAVAILYGLYVLQMKVSDILVFCGMLYIFYEPIKKFAEENNNIQKGIAAAERMFEVMSIKPKITDCKGAISLLEFQESIEFKDVWFRYEEEWVLKGVSFSVKKGETVAIVGPTGAGKSTISQLMTRLYEVEKGEILLDGKNLNTYQLQSLKDKIAFVSQKPFLFLDTVGVNIAFGRDFSKEKIIDAAKRAHAHEFILDLPEQYDFTIAEAGKNLSGGQQQRLAIARALIKESSILILDEATSSLDSVSENKIQKAVEELKGSVTQVIIAHRLSTIEDADKILYLDKGKVTAQGKKDELLERSPSFRLMWETMYNSAEKLI